MMGAGATWCAGSYFEKTAEMVPVIGLSAILNQLNPTHQWAGSHFESADFSRPWAESHFESSDCIQQNAMTRQEPPGVLAASLKQLTPTHRWACSHFESAESTH
jgi:hypothetical protein